MKVHIPVISEAMKVHIPVISDAMKVLILVIDKPMNHSPHYNNVPLITVESILGWC